jgi:hypothetical protein
LETKCCGSFVETEAKEGCIATIYDVKTLKGFVYLLGASIDGTRRLFIEQTLSIIFYR